LRQDVLLSSREVGKHVLHPYVHSHYRPLLTGSILLATMRGVLTWHNETANIWTHLFGFGWAASRLVAVQTAQAGSLFVRAAVGTFHLSAMAVLLASTAAHLYAPILPAEASKRLWRLDHACIIIAIGGSYVPGLQYGFRCYPLARTIYSAITCAGLLTSFYLTLLPRPTETGRDWLRIGALCTTVTFGLAPHQHDHRARADHRHPPSLSELRTLSPAGEFHRPRPGGLGVAAGQRAPLPPMSLTAVRAALAEGVPTGSADEDTVRRQWWAALATLQEDFLLPMQPL